jgi:flagellar L-ring protein precursor FlgH
MKIHTLALASLCAALGCAGPATTYKFPVRKYEPGQYAMDEAAQDGLLWGEHTANVIEDNRSRRLGDLVIVRVEEAADAEDSASTKTSKSSKVTAGVTNFFGIIEKLARKHPDVDTAALVSALYDSSFAGDGETSRSGNLSATIPCQVKQVLPNGDLFIEGTKTIQINREETHLYMSGVVRPYDIDMDNIVSSQRVLDARIDFSGRGVVSDEQGPGLLHRGMDLAWPM